MKYKILVAVSLFLCGCASKEFGSYCTQEPITISGTRHQPSAASVSDPLLFTTYNGTVVTVGRYDALTILSGRARESVLADKSVSLLLARLNAARTGDKPIDVATITPDLKTLRGEALNEGLLVDQEIRLLFLRALSRGDAVIGTDGHAYNTIIQNYTANLSDGDVSGVRVLQGDKVVYDYCGVTPRQP